MKTAAFFVLIVVASALGTAAMAAKKAAPGAPDPGAIVYQEVCQACHMENAMGAVGAGRIANLAKDENLESADYPIAVVTGGKGAMPWFRGNLSDQQIADVINHVRSHYGNRYRDKITAADVAERGVPAPARRGR